MDNILLESTVHWLSKHMTSVMLIVGFTKNVQKCNSHSIQNSLLAACCSDGRYVLQWDDSIIVGCRLFGTVWDTLASLQGILA